MSISILKEALSTSVHLIGIQLRKAAPDILTGIGIATGIGAFVGGCVVSTKLPETISKHKKSVEEIKNEVEHINDAVEDRDVDISQEEMIAIQKKSDIKLRKAYGYFGLTLVEMYAIPVGLLGISVASTLYANNIMSSRNATLLAAYSALDTSFKEYRKRVSDRYGDVAEREIRYDAVAKEEDIDEIDSETGEVTTTKETVYESNGNYSPFAIIFDESCPEWTKDANRNKTALRFFEAEINHELKRRGVTFVNDIREKFMLPLIPDGYKYGWVWDPYENNNVYIDFGLYNFRKHPENEAFLNGFERSFIIDLEPQGVVVDLLKAQEEASKKRKYRL